MRFRMFSKYPALILIILSSAFLSLALDQKYHTDDLHFGIITLTPDKVLNGAGSDVDSIAFWEAPDPLESLMFVTAKGNDLVEIWQYPFMEDEDNLYRELTFENSDGCLGGDRVNGVVVDRYQDLLYIAVSAPDNNICIFEITTDEVMFLEQIDINHDLGSEPNLGLLHHENEKTYLYLSADDVIYMYDTADMREIDEFEPIGPGEIEVVFGDDFYQRIYVPDEQDHTGVYVYNIQDDGTIEPESMINFGGEEIFDSDAEGALVYHCMSDEQDNGKGWIVVSDQREDLTDFEFFDRQSYRHLGTLNIEEVEMTDGIASVQTASPDYELGLFAAIDDDQQTVILSWKTILEATSLNCNK